MKASSKAESCDQYKTLSGALRYFTGKPYEAQMIEEKRLHPMSFMGKLKKSPIHLERFWLNMKIKRANKNNPPLKAVTYDRKALEILGFKENEHPGWEEVENKYKSRVNIIKKISMQNLIRKPGTTSIK